VLTILRKGNRLRGNELKIIKVEELRWSGTWFVILKLIEFYFKNFFHTFCSQVKDFVGFAGRRITKKISWVNFGCKFGD